MAVNVLKLNGRTDDSLLRCVALTMLTTDNSVLYDVTPCSLIEARQVLFIYEYYLIKL